MTDADPPGVLSTDVWFPKLSAGDSKFAGQEAFEGEVAKPKTDLAHGLEFVGCW